jgi:hypothetical protein
MTATVVLPDSRADTQGYHRALVEFVQANPYLNAKQIRQATGCTPASLAKAQRTIRTARAEEAAARPEVPFVWEKFRVRAYSPPTERLIRETLARLAAGPKIVIRDVPQEDDDDAQ